MINPFDYAGPADARQLVGRHQELQELHRAMATGETLLLLGPRRHGKTALIDVAAHDAADQGITVLRFDAEVYESLERMAEAVLARAAIRLGGLPQQVPLRLARHAAPLHPRLQLDDSDAGFSISLGIRPSGSGVRKADLPLLASAFDALHALAGEQDGRVVVVIEEVQQLLDLGGGSAERALRALVMQHTGIGYLLTSSATARLSTAIGPKGALKGLARPLMIGPLPRGDFYQLLQRGFAEAGFEVEPGALEVLLDLAQEVPYTVQQLAHRCWEWLREDPSRTLRVGDVAEQRARLVRQASPAMTQLWTGLHKAQKVALKAVLFERGQSLMSEEILSRYGIGVSTMKQALGALDRRGLIREEAMHGETRYRLDDPLLGAWLRMAQAQ